MVENLMPGPTWELIALGAVSMVVALIGAYAKGVSSRVERIESRVAAINEAMLKDYHPKSDVKDMMEDLKEVVSLFHVEMKSNFKELRDRFDKFEQLYGR